MTPGYIINYIEARYHITISYSKAWNARTKALTKILGDWESSYETLPQYLEALKSSNPSTITVTYFDHVLSNGSASINISLSPSSNCLGWTASVRSIRYTFTQHLLISRQIEPIEFRIRDIH